VLNFRTSVPSAAAEHPGYMKFATKYIDPRAAWVHVYLASIQSVPRWVVVWGVGVGMWVSGCVFVGVDVGGGGGGGGSFCVLIVGADVETGQEKGVAYGKRVRHTQLPSNCTMPQICVGFVLPMYHLSVTSHSPLLSNRGRQSSQPASPSVCTLLRSQKLKRKRQQSRSLSSLCTRG
jgi:hypothetical protein